jgi:hypothetical protein
MSRSHERTWTRALVAKIREARGFVEVGIAFERAARSEIGISLMNAVPLVNGVIDMGTTHMTSDFVSQEHLLSCYLDALKITERDTISARALFVGGPRLYDFARDEWTAAIRGTETYNEIWRPFRMERQVLRPLLGGSAPLGFLCVGRSAREKPFRDEEIRRFDRMASIVEEALCVSSVLPWPGAS